MIWGFDAGSERERLVADRFYMPQLPRSGTVALTGDEAHHLSRVRRLMPGARVELFDGRGQVREAVVTDAGKQAVTLELGESLAEVLVPVELTLASAVPKGERFDWLVEKATELGVARLVPLLAERSVVEPRGGKLDRLRRAIVEACKQCGRSRLMTLDDPVPLGDYLKRERSERRLIAHPGGGRFPGGELTSCALAVGPEGGFTEGEVAEALGAGWQAVSLGPTRLRIETAGLAGAAAVLAGGWPGGG
jgi:16S rRNA (uracil1498-N3)-methyltransferase